jgi:hypothetical protein
MAPEKPLVHQLMRLEPTTANADAYAEAYKRLPRAERRRLDRAAKRALKRYRGAPA